MDDPFRVPRVNLLVQSCDASAGAPVEIEDLRTGGRRRFASLQALAAWLAAEPDDLHIPRTPLPGDLR